MGVLGGIVASAAGSVSGGLAANALMGNTAYPSGGGIPGLTSTKTGNSGISPTVQVETGPALQFFQQAANAYQTNALTGLNYYGQAIQQATQQLTTGTTQANQTLAPLSAAGNNATNQYLRMLGVDALSPTAGIATQLGNLSPNYTDLSQQINAAETIKDPTQRAAAKANILSGLQSNIDTQATSSADQVKAIQAQISALGARPTLANTLNNYIAAGTYGQLKDASIAAHNDIAGQQAVYDSQLAALNNQLSTAQANATGTSLQNIYNNYNQNYLDNQNYLGYSGNEMNQQLANTPGYQFSLDQGNQAIQRSAAAAGMLNSGNTLASMDQYSQGLAQQTYGQYMNQLLGIASQGNQATSNIATNQVNLGNNQANLTQSGGQAALNTYTNIGQAWNNAYTNQGNTYTEIQLANMAAQNNAIQNSNAQKTSLAGQLMNYQSNANQLGYAQAQSQQYAQGFAGGGAPAGNTYTAGGLAFPDYTGRGWGGVNV